MTTATDSPSPLQWSIEHHPSEDTIQAVRSELSAHNIASSSIDASRDIAILLHDARRQLMGGIVATIWGQCAEVKYLWVHSSLRGQGYGSRLLQTMEQEAQAQQCRIAILDTYSFQAPAFYQRLGYEIFGVIEGYPEGQQKVFLKKSLSTGGISREDTMGSADSTSRSDATAKELEKFQGTWRQIAHERDGVADVPEERGWEPQSTFIGNTFEVKLADGNIVLRGTFKLDPTKAPKTIDWTDTFGQDAGKTFLAIYSLEGDRLVFCAADEGQERPKEFRAGPGQDLRVSQRVAP